MSSAILCLTCEILTENFMKSHCFNSNQQENLGLTSYFQLRHIEYFAFESTIKKFAKTFSLKFLVLLKNLRCDPIFAVEQKKTCILPN